MEKKEGVWPSYQPKTIHESLIGHGRKEKRKRINRENKLVVNFDPEDRAEFLTGFKKRKDARRKVALEQIVEKERQEKLKLRAEKRKELKTLLEKHGLDKNDEELDAPEPQIKDQKDFDSEAQLVTVSVVSLNSDDENEEDEEKPKKRGQRQPKNKEALTPRQLLARKRVQEEKARVLQAKVEQKIKEKSKRKKNQAMPKQKLKKGAKKARDAPDAPPPKKGKRRN
eukprot:m.80606 g.80606  ORF g.80606 m.80606 type:complete len:226 (+) comp12770_c0_seq2:197-874(+)